MGTRSINYHHYVPIRMSPSESYRAILAMSSLLDWDHGKYYISVLY
jgi:hypothetical protein